MYNSNRHLILSSFWIRIIGLVTMTFDHIGVFLVSNADRNIAQAGDIFRIIGRIAFPLFIFLLAEGMRYSHNKEKYLLRMGGIYVLLTVAQVIGIYGMGIYQLNQAPNPFADLILVALVLYFLSGKQWWKKLIALIPAGILITSFILRVLELNGEITITWWPFPFRPAYSLLGLGAGVLFYYSSSIVTFFSHKTNQYLGISDDLYRESPSGIAAANIVRVLFLASIVLGLWGLSYINERSIDPMNMSFQAWCLLACIPLLLYNGQKGYSSLWFRIFSYAYFPVHLIIIFLIFGL